MKRGATWGILMGVCVLAAVLIWQWRVLVFPAARESSFARAVVGRMAWLDRVGWIGSPGPLNAVHADLTRHCQACHIPFRRVADLKCLSCHVQNTTEWCPAMRSVGDGLHKAREWAIASS